MYGFFYLFNIVVFRYCLICFRCILKFDIVIIVIVVCFNKVLKYEVYFDIIVKQKKVDCNVDNYNYQLLFKLVVIGR